VLVGCVKQRAPCSPKEGYPLQVLVRDNNVDQALRVLKKKMQREGLFREMKQRRAYEKPSERKAREKSEAVRRARKLARKKAQREGLMPDPRKKKLDDKRRQGPGGGPGSGPGSGPGGGSGGGGSGMGYSARPPRF
jgi:ribosomal protein S21